MVEISIIIPTQAAPHLLPACLESIRSQKFDFGKLEVLICLNNAVSEPPRLKGQEKLIRAGSGVNHARNKGIEAASGEILFFLDDDCRLQDPEFLNRLQTFFLETPEADGVGGHYLSDSRNVFETIYNKNSTVWIQNSLFSGKRSLFLLGGNFAARRKVTDADCLFDESIQWGGAELGFFISAAQKEFSFFYQPELSVRHDCRLSGWRFFRKLKKQAKTTQRLLRLGYLPRLESNLKVEGDTQKEKWVIFLMESIFLRDKSTLFFRLLLAPFRWIPRERVAQAQRDYMGYFLLSKKERDL